MTTKPQHPSVVQGLLARAHSPDSAQRIFSEKIQHRTLFLRPSSPPPAANARNARRKARQEKEQRRKALKPKPLSASQRRKLGLHTVPREGQRHEIFEPLHRLWLGYIREILGSELYSGAQNAAAKLSAADFHGAEIEVSRSSCPSRVGIRGIVAKDSKFVFEIITKRDGLKIVPKEGTMFRVRVPVADKMDASTATEAADKEFVFEIHGDQFRHRAADRASKKFKAHFLKDL